MKKALITGITGQDGSYLAEYLLSLGYEVHGIIRKVTNDSNLCNIRHLKNKIILHIGTLSSLDTMICILSKVRPDEVYNLAAQSDAKISYDIPIETMDANSMGTLRLLEAIRQIHPTARVYHASSTLLFDTKYSIQNENTPFDPTSVYVCSKIAAYYQCINYKNAFNLFIAQGIASNHESPRRPDWFFSRKVSKAVARIKLGLDSKLVLGNLESGRDFGFAGDYVKAMHLILQYNKPDEFVISTNVCTKLKTFLDIAFKVADLKWDKYIEIDKSLFRPLDNAAFCADNTKIKNTLSWEPVIKIDKLIEMMVLNDIKQIKEGK